MSSGGARRGRRDNGLDAAAYAAAGDVDPRVGEHLLDMLAVHGIAAYLTPAVDLNPITRNTMMPARPTDRLFVDRAHLDTARDYLARLAADQHQPPDPQPQLAEFRPTGTAPSAAAAAPAEADRTDHDGAVDDAWAQIVAGYDTEVDGAAGHWPEAENLPSQRRTDADPAGPDPGTPGPQRRSSPAPGDEPSLLDGLDTFGADLPDADPDEGYTPPPPPPLPRISVYAVLGVLAIVGGFVLFLRPSLLPLDGDVSMLVGFTAILAGFGTLLWRLRPGDEDEDDPDDGARV